ncbi:hypothetical protein [Microbacterium oleivorans]|uniref:Uncharacterized protein n=1 Tax=Microbacterium oleivorans TaxID=273677 RepID=A0A7D5JG93_9MICO|nr:hypothetical protein [Microbacterium oleivorans]QLD12438.1 hypothetical protein HW566_12065 [Microbacterium oleivorans]
MSPIARKPSALRLATSDALRQLPTRRPEPARTDAAVCWELVDVDRYEVREGQVVLGYIDVVGAVYVALGGPWYSASVELRQTLRFEDAVQTLRSTRRH